MRDAGALRLIIDRLVAARSSRREVTALSCARLRRKKQKAARTRGLCNSPVRENYFFVHSPFHVPVYLVVISVSPVCIFIEPL